MGRSGRGYPNQSRSQASWRNKIPSSPFARTIYRPMSTNSMITKTHDNFKCSIHHWCYMIWWFGGCHVLVFYLFIYLFFCICFTMNRAMMLDCTITCCEIYVLWCCFRSVHCIVLYRVLERASFFFGFRERERERERLVILDLDLLEFVILVNLIKLLGWFLSWRLVSLLWENVMSGASRKRLVYATNQDLPH